MNSLIFVLRIIARLIVHRGKRKLLVPCGWLMMYVAAMSCAPTPDITDIWYVSYDGDTHTYEINSINPVTRGSLAIIRTQQNEALIWPSLSPDGAKLAYITDGVWVANSDGTNRRRISDDQKDEDYFWLDNDSLVILRVTAPNQLPYQGEWSLYDLSARQQRPLSTEGERLIYCPIERSKALAGKSPFDEENNLLGHWQISDNVIKKVMDVNIRRDQLSSRGLGCPSWTPDGQKVAIAVETPSFSEEIFLISDHGQSVKQLTHFEKSYMASPFHLLELSPDGRWVIAQGTFDSPRVPNMPEGFQIVLINTENQQAEFLGERHLEGNFAWSPDSRYVAVSLSPRGTDPESTLGEVHIVDVLTKGIKQLTFDGRLKRVFDWR